MSTAGTVIASILGFIALFYVNLYAGSYRMRKAATAFLNALRQRRFSDAHARLSSPLRSRIPAGEFEAFLEQRGVFAVKTIKRHLGDFSIGTNRGTLEPWVIREDGIFFKVKLQMAREKMKWTVAAIDVQRRVTPMPMRTATEAAVRRDQSPEPPRSTLR